MLNKIFYFVVLILLQTSIVYAAGFEPGAMIRAVEKNGQVVEGTILNYENTPEISLLDKSGHYFKIHIKDVRKISGVAGQTVITGGGTKLHVIALDLVNGQSVSGGLNTNCIVKINMGVKGQRTVWITDPNKYQFVEIVEKTAGGPSDGLMKVYLTNGQIIEVPVKKSDIHSIVFE